jgi:hypothetical protein
MERMSHPRWTPGETTEQVRALFIAPSFFFFFDVQRYDHRELHDITSL